MGSNFKIDAFKQVYDLILWELIYQRSKRRDYRSGTVNSESFVGKDFLRIKWKYELAMFELTVHFKHEMIGKHFTETSNKVELRINRVRVNRARPVL